MSATIRLREFIVLMAAIFGFLFCPQMYSAAVAGQGQSSSLSEDGEDSLRNNQVTFMEYCDELFQIFLKLKTISPQYADDQNDRSFDEIRADVAEIHALEAKKEDRCVKWQQAAKMGKLIFTGEIPDYEEDAIASELREVSEYKADKVFGDRVWNFVRASEIMRNTILYELLPAQGTIG